MAPTMPTPTDPTNPGRFDPWQIRESELDLDRLAWSESVFALSNGHLGLRGNLEEGEPTGCPGTYLNSVFEFRPLPYAEASYGDPESGQTVINVTNGKVIRLLVDDEPFDVRYGELVSHERVLDLRAGCLHRSVDWISPAGQRIRIRSTRLVSLTQRSVAAISYEVEAVDHPARIVVQSELIANEPLPEPRAADPRVAARLASPLSGEHHAAQGSTAVLVHRVEHSRLAVAAAMDHEVIGGDHQRTIEATEDLGRFTVTAVLQAGETLRLIKYLGYGWSSSRTAPAMRDQVDAALSAARFAGWDGLVAEQRAYLDEFWRGADVEVGGDPEVQQAMRFALFHVLQAGARTERRPIASKGLTGSGYDGHSFWDTEAFVLPVLMFTVPTPALDALAWRHSTLDQARHRAEALDLCGAAFPWRTINGDECSGYWPAGTAAFHVNAAIARAVCDAVDVTGDTTFEERFGVELLVETARLWRSLGHDGVDGRFRIDGVTGPDEYSAIADNNVYTNLMARANLRDAAAAAERYPDRAGELGVDADEIDSWRSAADAVYIGFDERLGVHPQADGFTDHQEWDFSGTDPEQYPLLRSFPYFDLYRKQVLKQADLILAIQFCADAFDTDQKRRDFDYYERLTVRDSSLSAVTQSVVAAEVGHVDLAYDYLAECALLDLSDLHNNTDDGVHLGALAGSWTAAVTGLGGMRHRDGELSFSPCLPRKLDHLGFGLTYRGRRIRVMIAPDRVEYRMGEGEPLELRHDEQRFRLDTSAPRSFPLARTPGLPEPEQPPGRTPLRRRRH